MTAEDLGGAKVYVTANQPFDGRYFAEVITACGVEGQEKVHHTTPLCRSSKLAVSSAQRWLDKRLAADTTEADH